MAARRNWALCLENTVLSWDMLWFSVQCPPIFFLLLSSFASPLLGYHLVLRRPSCLYFIVGGRGFRWSLGTSVCCQFTEEASSLWGNWLNEVQRRKMTTLVKDVKQSQPVDPQSYAGEPQSSWWQVLLLSCQADRVPTRVDTGSLFLGGSTLCLAVLFFAFLWTASCLNVL